MSEPIPARVPRGSLIVPIEFAKKAKAFLRKNHIELRGRPKKGETGVLVMLHSGELIVPPAYRDEVKAWLKAKFGVKLPLKKSQLKDTQTAGVQAAKGKTIQQVNIQLAMPKARRARAKQESKPAAPKEPSFRQPVVVAPTFNIPAVAPVAAPVAPPVAAPVLAPSPASISFPAPSGGLLPGSIPSSFAAAVAPSEETEEKKEPVAASVAPPLPPRPVPNEFQRDILDVAAELSKSGVVINDPIGKHLSMASWIKKLEQVGSASSLQLADRLRRKYPPKTQTPTKWKP